jgi:hypothetical protein
MKIWKKTFKAKINRWIKLIVFVVLCLTLLFCMFFTLTLGMEVKDIPLGIGFSCEVALIIGGGLIMLKFFFRSPQKSLKSISSNKGGEKMKFPNWFGHSMGFDDAGIVVKECRKINNCVPPEPPEVKENHCLVLVTEGAENKLIGLAFCGPKAFEAYHGAVLSIFEGNVWLYEASKEFLEQHGQKSKF